MRTVPQSGTLTVPSTSRAVGERFTAAAAFTPARPGRLTWLEARTGYDLDARVGDGAAGILRAA